MDPRGEIGDQSLLEQGDSLPELTLDQPVEMPAIADSHISGLTQTQHPGHLGQFKIHLVKPLVPFLTLPYLRAQRIFQLARTVNAFHMQSIYIARQALHLVILLNEMVDAKDGPDDEQHEESIALEDELIELSDAMKGWGGDNDGAPLGSSDSYEQHRLKIEQQYALLFKDRSYFKETRDATTDLIFKRLLAYDEKTIRFRRYQVHQAGPSTIVEVERRTTHGPTGIAEDQGPGLVILEETGELVSMIPSSQPTPLADSPHRYLLRRKASATPMHSPDDHTQNRSMLLKTVAPYASGPIPPPPLSSVMIGATGSGSIASLQRSERGELPSASASGLAQSHTPNASGYSQGNVEETPAGLGLHSKAVGTTAGDGSPSSPVITPDACLVKDTTISPDTALGQMISKITPSEADQKKYAEDYEKLATKLGQQPLILQELKEIAGGSDFLAPFKAFFGFTDSILKIMESVETTESKWKGLRDDILDHLTYVRNDLKGDPSTKVLTSDSPRIRYLKVYSDELITVFKSYLLERGLSGDNVTQEQTPSTEYVKEASRFFKKATTVTLDAGKVSSLQARLSKAFQNYERSKITSNVARHFELWDAKIAELLGGNRTHQPFGSNATESTISPGGMKHGKCYSDTRKGIREAIDKWAGTSQGPPFYVLFDFAGTGKSTVAHHLACDWQESNRLVASFFFSRVIVGASTFSDLIRHIAGRLWRCQEVKNHPSMTYDYITDALDESRSTREQWEMLVVHPLSILTSGSADDNRPFLLVIDAMDECSEDSRQHFLHALKEMLDVNSLSYGHVKVLLTSRPEPELVTAFREFAVKGEEMKSHKVDGADVDIYVEHRFKEMGLGTEDAQRLAKYANGLFIFATTACDLLNKSPQKAPLLDRMLRDQKPLYMNRLTALYVGILESKLNTDTCNRKVIQNIFRIVLAARRPLLVSEIDQLLSDEGVDVAATIEDFFSVLGGGSGDNPVYIRHQTFREFMLDSKVSGEYGGVTIESAHQFLGLCCLTTMKRELKFNICDLETSCLPNAKIQGLEGRLQQMISNALQYSCMHWSYHLCYDMVLANVEVSRLVVKFFSGEWLLYWLEVLSLTGKVMAAASALRQIEASLQKFQGLYRHVVEDALRFVLAFHTPILISAPHIYLSALPFIPVESTLWESASKQFPKLLAVCKGRMRSWPTRPSESRGHTSMVISIAYSPDGRHVVSGSYDRTIRIWDASTGAAVGEPLTGHTDGVISVAYSPDGRHVVSGSYDRTIRIWDASTGAAVGEALTGHTSAVSSVAYSPDGRHVVSGSYDCTIRIWDASTGAAVGELLTGHTSTVNSVAYSPDGRHVVSGSYDRTVRIWDASTGAAVGEPLTGHTDGVSSVAYSPDGRHIVSGSYDRTIRIWDASTGAAVGEPLTGHTNVVSSVAYSPDGRHIVSGSYDRTIRIWDASTGAAVGEPLTGHTDVVTSVAYSPDGRHIVSGSYDRTIRIWDASTGAAVGEPLVGHTNVVSSVAYSPDGRHIVSGSYDRTIRIWDASTGAAVGEPLTGHTGVVSSVAYSPDGRHVVSGSYDRTIRIWDASTGAAVGELLTGHTSTVNSVAYSPDGRHVVSGSYDRTIRIWDASTGAAVGELLTGHTSTFSSVAYSPDGRHVVSGSHDRTIRIWDASTEAAVGKPLAGHTNSASSVAYSPDCRHVVSGSYDRTIRIWDASTGAAVGEALTGHTSAVSSVAYSPDGRHVVSGSYDRTIRIWDASTGAAVGELLTGHTSTVSSVAYSPDGRHVVSGSHDCTIRIWDASTEAEVGKPLAGHTNWVSSVAYSPDSHHVVSGSNDSTIQAWDTITGVVDDEHSVLPEPSNPPARIWDAANFLSTSHSSLAAFSGLPIPSQLLDSNGWLHDADGLLFWIPEDYRNGITSPAVMAIPDTGRSRSVRLDFTHFRHGTSWIEVYGDVNGS